MRCNSLNSFLDHCCWKFPHSLIKIKSLFLVCLLIESHFGRNMWVHACLLQSFLDGNFILPVQVNLKTAICWHLQKKRQRSLCFLKKKLTLVGSVNKAMGDSTLKASTYPPKRLSTGHSCSGPHSTRHVPHHSITNLHTTPILQRSNEHYRWWRF